MAAPSDKDDGTAIARRKLLRLGLWTAPAVIGVALVSRRAAAATCVPNQTCPPNCAPNCSPNNPCSPDSPCGPDNPCKPDQPCKPGT